MQVPADGSIHQPQVSRGLSQFLHVGRRWVKAQRGEGLGGGWDPWGSPHLVSAGAVLLTHVSPAQEGPAPGPQGRGMPFRHCIFTCG